MRHHCVIVIYVDDCLLFSAHDTVLDGVLAHLHKSFKITSEADVGAYLGLDIRRTAEGHMEITQPGLIDKVISICGLEHESNEHKTLADCIWQAMPSQDEPQQLAWNYRQVVGILNYIAASSHPDISFAVHQCARFSQFPGRIHELAVKRIVRYLKGTRNKGYVLRPTSTKSIDCYVDADFAGSWTPQTSGDSSSVHSRSGYIITYASCPLLWASKLQSEIALSTTESEYISLSQSLHDLIPLKALLAELADSFCLEVEDITAHSTVFEDNKACVDLIAAPTMRPRTRHIAIKYHHFREHVRRGDIRIKWIPTDMQLADIFTTPLTYSKFSTLRAALLGW